MGGADRAAYEIGRNGIGERDVGRPQRLEERGTFTRLESGSEAFETIDVAIRRVAKIADLLTADAELTGHAGQDGLDLEPGPP